MNRFTNSSRSGCVGKIKFPNHGAAHKAMRRTVEQKKIVGETNVYACRICGGFHWGHAKGTIIDRSQRLRNAIDKAIAQDAAKRKSNQ